MHTPSHKRTKPTTALLDKISARQVYDASISLLQQGQPLTLDSMRRELGASPGLVTRLKDTRSPLRLAYEAAKHGDDFPPHLATSVEHETK